MMAETFLAQFGDSGDPNGVRPEAAHLTAEQKRELIAKLLKATPEQSNRQIGARAGTTHKVVAAVRRKMEATGQIARLTATVGKDGKKRAAKPQQEQVAQRGRKV